MKEFVKEAKMRILPITTATVKKNIYNTTKEFVQSNPDNISQSVADHVNFGAGEDIGDHDIMAPENENYKKPGFKKGFLAVVTMLTFPVSFPIWVWREAYLDKHKDDFKTDIDPNNITASDDDDD